MKKIDIVNRWSNAVLFSYEAEENSVLITLKEAVKRGAYLQGADLRGADLQGADLRGANLQDAYLQGANLQGANLRGAYLQGADLRGAYLRGADLRGADLQGANLQGAYLRGAYLQDIKIKKAIVITGLYKYIAMPIITEDDKHWIKLGCHLRTVEDWEKDFWNNNNEFPNDNSIKSQLRVLALETCKRWLEINKEV